MNQAQVVAHTPPLVSQSRGRNHERLVRMVSILSNSKGNAIRANCLEIPSVVLLFSQEGNTSALVMKVFMAAECLTSAIRQVVTTTVVKGYIHLYNKGQPTEARASQQSCCLMHTFAGPGKSCCVQCRG